MEGSVCRAQVILLVVDLCTVLYDIISYNIPPCVCSMAGKHRCVAQVDRAVKLWGSTQARRSSLGREASRKALPPSTQ